MSDDDRPLAEVRPLPGVDLPDESLAVDQHRTPPWSAGACGHLQPLTGYIGRVVIDRDLHVIRCRDCDEPLDPIRALEQISDEWVRIRDRHREAVAQHDAAQARLANVLHQEKLAKARRRNADRLTPAAVVLAAAYTALLDADRAVRRSMRWERNPSDGQAPLVLPGPDTPALREVERAAREALNDALVRYREGT